MAIKIGCLSWWCRSISSPVMAVLLLPLVLTASASSLDDLSCLKLKTSGATFPAGDINKEYGDALEIYCILDPKKTERNASSLTFESNNKEVPREYLSVVNSTTLRLYMKKPPPSESMYYCKLRAEPENNLPAETVCLNSVHIGFKPQEVKNFSCISMNWENLTCTWDLPVHFMKTKTKLEYYLPGRAGGRFSYPCPDGTHENKCFWDRTTSVVYRQPYNYYFFKLTIENPLGNLTQLIKFHHYAYVIPSKPVNSTVLNKTSNSVLIQWSVGFPMQNFPPGVMQKVEYHSLWDPKDTWHSVDVSHLNRKAKTHTLNITGLQYAHTSYDIRIYMKSPDATGEDKWSKPASLTVKTLPDVPGAPPKTDIGSFEVSRGLPYRDIYVYWQQIPEYLFNGDHFEYQVYRINENGVESILRPDESEKSYARFKSLGFKDYHLRIYSANEKGLSTTGSDIYIPAVQDIVAEPITFTKIAFENGIYELSWKIPADHSKIESYTIFWCDNKQDRPFQCNGYLNWTHVKKETFIKNITVPEDKVYQFAVSANSLNSSSGMVWASCTVIHNKVVGKMKSVWINNIGSTFIELGWKLECSDRVGVVKGFRIYYCPLESPRAEKCKGGVESNTTIMGDPPLTGHGNVTDLIPYTTYMLSVAVLTKSGEGLHSDVLFNTTLEDAPDPPQNIVVSNVTNTSVVVSWEPPVKMNGVLRAYLVQYYPNNGSSPVETLDLRVMLKNLLSYVRYNISVSARTTVSSPPVYVSVKTLIGVPGLVEQPSISPVVSSNNLNKSQMSINWTRPQNPRGEIDYYQVMLTKSNDNRNDSEIHSVNGRSIVFKMECEGVEHLGQSLRYMVYVRAVNVRSNDEDNVTLYGPWSSPGIRSCYNPGFPVYVQIFIILFIMMAAVSFLFGLAYIAKRFYHIIKDCWNVPIKLPALFNIQANEKDLENHKRMHGLQTELEKKNTDLNIYCTPPAPDQELLLFKKAENECDGDADSSGCSSAHESVSSSLTSGTHISDSGTEDQPESPPTLRQRIVGRDGTTRMSQQDQYVVIGGITESTPNSIESDLAYSRLINRGGTGYCVVGNIPQTSSKAYARVGQASSPPISNSVTDSGYVSQPPVSSDTKTSVSSTSGPLSAPASKGYVMAGSLPVVQSPSVKHPSSASSSSYCRLGTTTDYITLPSTSTNPDL